MSLSLSQNEGVVRDLNRLSRTPTKAEASSLPVSSRLAKNTHMRRIRNSVTYLRSCKDTAPLKKTIQTSYHRRGRSGKNAQISRISNCESVAHLRSYNNSAIADIAMLSADIAGPSPSIISSSTDVATLSCQSAR